MNRYLVLDLYNKDDALYFGNKFLTDSKKWLKEIKTKQKEMDAILELSAITNSEVHSGHISHPTENAALDKMKIQTQIDRRIAYANLLKDAFSHLTEEQQKIIKAFYFTKGRSINSLVHDISEEIGCSYRSVYRRKEQAILDLVTYIRENIN